MNQMSKILSEALDRRAPLLEELHDAATDCYRLLHGSTEGLPGVTVDRYGPQVLVQSFHQAYEPQMALDLGKQAAERLGLEEHIVYHDRSGAKLQHYGCDSDDSLICHELGVAYEVRDRHRGQDPLLFLDLRCARRLVKETAAGLSVLNLFAYTCGVGLCAALGGAAEVWNVDFAASNLAVAERNARLNGIGQGFSLVQEDFFVAARQLAGLGVKGRGARRSYTRYEPRQFDLVFLDPPAWGKSPFGAVDLKRDYPSLLKPALLCTADGGRLICTNNLASVDLDDWLEQLRRAAQKAGRPFKDIDLIRPEADFPPMEGRHALKIAIMTL